MLNEFLINLTWSYFLATVCYVLVESPILKNERMFVQYLKKSDSHDSAVVELEAVHDENVLSVKMPPTGDDGWEAKDGRDAASGARAAGSFNR